MTFCPNCGKPVEGQFCANCGARLTTPIAPQVRPAAAKKPIVTAILVLLIILFAGLAISPYIMPSRIQPLEEQPVTITVPTTSTVSNTLTTVQTLTETTMSSSTEIMTNPVSSSFVYSSSTSNIIYSYSTSNSIYLSSTSTSFYVTTYQAQTTHPRTTQNGQSCDPSYPTVCIPPPPPDLDCKDIPYRNFKVLPPDPHHFDGDHDGVGCET
jgi:hypothetical protein